MDFEMEKRPEGLTALPLEMRSDYAQIPEIRLLFAVLEQALRDCLTANDQDILESAVRFIIGRDGAAVAKLVGVSTSGWKKLRVLALQAAAARRRDLQIAEVVGS